VQVGAALSADRTRPARVGITLPEYDVLRTTVAHVPEPHPAGKERTMAAPATDSIRMKRGTERSRGQGAWLGRLGFR